jgi:hypothetical protein
MPRRRGPKPRSIVESTHDYEVWLGAQIPLVTDDLAAKHTSMGDKRNVLPFFRATFYRWAEQFPRCCPEAMEAPSVLGVGDVHLDNFGTWRDAEGRLVWGVNDFDEAVVLPFTNDLVRVATAAVLSDAASPRSIARTILDGYEEWLERAGRPILLEESHGRLRTLALAKLGDPKKFWDELLGEKLPVTDVPPEVLAMLEAAFPGPSSGLEPFRRRSGLGSLGRPRYVLAGPWQGSHVARETKRLVPSAWNWAAGHEPADRPAAPELLATAVRCVDPFVSIEGWWQTRRLAADCRRIDIRTLADVDDVKELLRAMGREVANVHLADPGRVPEIVTDLRRRRDGWLADAAKRMAAVVTDDWRAWRRHR